MPNSSARGFTLTEVMFSSVIGGVVISACATLFFAVGQRMNVNAPRTLVTSQVNLLADEIDAQARNAVDATILTVGTHQVLQLRVANTGTDIDSDGVPETVTPTSIASDGSETFSKLTANTKVYSFYWSGSTGVAYTVASGVATRTDGSYLWRGLDDGLTTLVVSGSGIDSKWSWIGDRSRWNLIKSVTYAYDSGDRVLTYTITAAVRTVTDTQPSATELAENQQSYSVTRKVWLRNG
ncbi:MAG: prepilin-type N-terminal cleavage/methylation domain-containing protein [Armatimonadota bacterium]